MQPCGELKDTDIFDLPPPDWKVKLIVRLMVWGELAEAMNGYLILTLGGLAIGAFGPFMVASIFWLCNLVLLLEVSVKLLRNWADTIRQVKCVHVAAQWEVFKGFKWSLLLRFWVLMTQGVLYTFLWVTTWQMRKRDSDLPHDGTGGRWTPRLYELLVAVCGLVTLHWVLGVWVLGWSFCLWVTSGLTLLLMIPTPIVITFSTIVQKLTSYYFSLVLQSRLACSEEMEHNKILKDFYQTFIDKINMEIELGFFDHGQPDRDALVLSSLTWYVHYRRHPTLLGLVATSVPDCGLPVSWSLNSWQLVLTVLSVRGGIVKMSTTAQAMLLQELMRRISANVWEPLEQLYPLTFVELLDTVITNTEVKEIVDPAKRIVLHLLENGTLMRVMVQGDSILKFVVAKSADKLVKFQHILQGQRDTDSMRVGQLWGTQLLKKARNDGFMQTLEELQLTGDPIKQFLEGIAGNLELQIISLEERREMPSEEGRIMLKISNTEFKAFCLDMQAEALRELGKPDEAKLLQEKVADMAHGNDEIGKILELNKDEKRKAHGNDEIRKIPELNSDEMRKAENATATGDSETRS